MACLKAMRVRGFLILSIMFLLSAAAPSYTSPTLNAIAMPGADMCAKINTAIKTAVDRGWTNVIIDARGFHGTQTVTTNPCIQNVPATAGGGFNVTFAAKIITQDVNIQTGFCIEIPGSFTWDGNTGYGLINPPYTNVGTTIQPSNSFTLSTTCPYQAISLGAISAAGSGYAAGDTITLTGGTFSTATIVTVRTVSAGAITAYSISTPGAYTVKPANPISQGSTSGSGTGATFTINYGLPLIVYSDSTNKNSAYGIQLRNMSISCLPPNGTYTTMVGVQNWYAEENSGGYNLNINSCTTDLDIETAAATNSGPWDSIITHSYGVTDADAKCLTYGSKAASTNTAGKMEFHNFTCAHGMETTGLQANVGIAIDGWAVSLEDVHCEQALSCIQIGRNGTPRGVLIKNGTCTSTMAHAMTSCIDISAIPTVVEVTLLNTVAIVPAYITNIIKDNQVGGGTVVAGANSVSDPLYWHQAARVYDALANVQNQNTTEIHFQCSGTIPASGNDYPVPFNGVSGVSCQNSVSNQMIAPVAVTARNLFMTAGTGGVNASSGVVTLRVGGVDSALTCTFGIGTSCSDTTHTASIGAGVSYHIKVTAQTSETLANLSGSFILQQ